MDLPQQLVDLSGYGQGEIGRVTAELAQRAAREGLAPILGARLKAGEIEAEAGVVELLLDAHRRCALANTMLSMTAEPVFQELERREIPALLLKGGALLETVYRDAGARTMADLDILVPGERWLDALEAARTAGARSVDAPRRPLTLRFYHELHFLLPGGGMLDLHRRLCDWPLFAVDHDALFREARRRDGASDSANGGLLPSPEDLFLGIALHASKDGFFLPLRSLVDGLALLQRTPPDPTLVEARARAWSARRATARWLQLLESHGPLDAPWVELRRRLAPRLPALPADFQIRLDASQSRRAWRLRTRWRQARSQDNPLRPAGLALRWSLMYAGDFGQRCLSKIFVRSKIQESEIQKTETPKNEIQ